VLAWYEQIPGFHTAKQKKRNKKAEEQIAKTKKQSTQILQNIIKRHLHIFMPKI
jgi:hypothetical protein